MSTQIEQRPPPEAPEQTAPGQAPPGSEELIELSRLIASIQDGLSDDIINRLARSFSEGLILLDRLTRNEGLLHLLQEMDRLENQRFLISMSDAITAATRDLAAAPPANGGIVGLLRLARDPGALEGLRLMSMIGARLSASLRELHRSGT